MFEGNHELGSIEFDAMHRENAFFCHREVPIEVPLRENIRIRGLNQTSESDEVCIRRGEDAGSWRAPRHRSPSPGRTGPAAHAPRNGDRRDWFGLRRYLGGEGVHQADAQRVCGDGKEHVPLTDIDLEAEWGASG